MSDQLPDKEVFYQGKWIDLILLTSADGKPVLYLGPRNTVYFDDSLPVRNKNEQVEPEKEKTLLTTAQAAEMLGISQQSVRTLIKKGELKSVRYYHLAGYNKKGALLDKQEIANFALANQSKKAAPATVNAAAAIIGTKEQ